MVEDNKRNMNYNYFLYQTKKKVILHFQMAYFNYFAYQFLFFGKMACF